MQTFRDDDYVNLNLISDFIDDFIAQDQRSRLHFLLSKPNRRQEIEQALAHDTSLDARFLIGIEPDENSPDAIYRRLKKWGAKPMCFALGSRSMDNGEVDLKLALESHVNRGFGSEITLYCAASKVGYWRGVDGNEEHWLLRRAF